MRCECPELRRCCLCLPLRFGLIGIAWIKIILDVIFWVPLLFNNWSRYPMYIYFSLITLVYIVDVCFNCVLLRGCHQKDPGLLRVFYRYSLVLLALNIIFVVGITIFDIVLYFQSPFAWILTLYSFISFLTFCVVSIIIHLYLSILVRSEMQKLEATTQFQFTNNIQAACTLTERDDGTSTQ